MKCQRLIARRRVLIAAAAVALIPAAVSQDAERRVPVVLDEHDTHRLEDTISDFESVSYVVTLRQGQSLRVLLATNNASNCFDIYEPDAAKPIYIGGDSGNTHELHAQRPGNYRIRVFLLRLAARDGQSAQYTLELKVTG